MAIRRRVLGGEQEKEEGRSTNGTSVFVISENFKWFGMGLLLLHKLEIPHQKFKTCFF
jgi:hypothetical protein